MSNVGSNLANLVLTFSLLENEFDKGWNIVEAHLLKVEFPELLLLWIESCVSL